jgi:hypothetical protein
MIGFRKSLKLAPGIRLTAGRRGLSVSGGPRGAKVSVNTRRERRAGLGWFGMFWRRRI